MNTKLLLLFLFTTITSSQLIKKEDLGDIGKEQFSFTKNQDSSEITIKQVTDDNTFWYRLAIKDGCPSFEISGIQGNLDIQGNPTETQRLEDLDELRPFKSFVNLDMTQVGLIGKEISLKGGQTHWSPIVIEESKDSYILHSTMVRKEQDHSGNPFTIYVEGSISKKGDSLLVVKEMVKNFPYPSYITSQYEDSGKLHITNVIEYSNGLRKSIVPFNLYGRKLNLGTMGGVDILESSVREDGNLLNVFLSAEEVMDPGNDYVSLQTDLGFSSSFPKNTTFSMDMRLDKAEFMRIPESVFEGHEKKSVVGLSNAAANFSVTAGAKTIMAATAILSIIFLTVLTA